MSSPNNHSDNCQLQEKKIIDEHVTLKKLLSLKSKIFHTDTLIRKFKEQKDENLRLVSECEKAQTFCAKYEIDLKLALEELHSLRNSEKEFKNCTSRLESEIETLRENLQAEKALVKQYKCLVEKDEKSTEQIKDKAFKDLEKKLTKKDDKLSKVIEKIRITNKKLSFVSRSHLKALKFLRKIGNHPALHGVLPATDRKALQEFSQILQNENPFKFTAEYTSETEDGLEFEESQQLEELLLDPVIDYSSVDTEVSGSRLSIPTPPLPSILNSVTRLDGNNNNDTLKEKDNNDGSEDDWEDVCEQAESCNGLNHDERSSDSVSLHSDMPEVAPAPRNELESDGAMDVEVFNGSSLDVLVEQASGVESNKLIAGGGEGNGESMTHVVKNTEKKSDNETDQIVNSISVPAENVVSENGTLVTDVPVQNSLEDEENVSDDVNGVSENMDVHFANNPTENDNAPPVVENIDEALQVDLVKSTEVIVQCMEEIGALGCESLEQRKEEESLEQGKEEESLEQGKEEQCSVKEKSKNLFVGSKECSLPLIPFSKERQFQPLKASSKSVSVPSLLFKDPGDIIKELIQETTVEKSNLSVKETEHRKSKRSVKHVSKICSRMKYTTLLERPVSPLPPSPPPTPTQSEKFDVDCSDSLPTPKSVPPKLVELFGSDSEEDNAQKLLGKSALQHQESEGFDPDLETQENAQEERSRRLDATLSSIVDTTNLRRQQNQMELYKNDRSANRQYSKDDRNPHKTANTRLCADVTMDKQSGRCKISIQLPDSVNSASNFKLEVDTFTRELHLDYGPSPSGASNSYNPGEALVKPVLTRNDNPKRHQPPSSPAISLMDDSLIDSPLFDEDDIGQPKQTTDSSASNKSPFQSTPLPLSSVVPVRRASAPAIGHALRRLANERKSVTFANHCYKPPGSDLGTKCDARPESPVPVFKTPATRSRKSLVSQNALVVRTESVNADVEPALKPIGDDENSRGHVMPTYQVEDHAVNCKNDTSTLSSIEEDKLIPTKTRQKNNTTMLPAIEEGITTRTRQKNNSTLPAIEEEGMPMKTRLKRKFESLCSTEEDSLTKCSKSFKITSSDSAAVKRAKIFHNASEGQLKINTKILRTLKRLEELQGNDDNDSTVIFHLITDLCNPNLISDQDEFVDSAILYFSRSKADVLSKFDSRQKFVKPLLALREECFVSLTKRLQDRKANMKNLLEHFRVAVSGHLMKSGVDSAPGCACLCRLHAACSKLEGNVKAPRALCYNLLLKKHPLASYLVANLLIVWPMILTLCDNSAVQDSWRKVLSWLLFRKVVEEPIQEVLTRKVLIIMGKLQPPGDDFQVDSFTEQLIGLLKSQEDPNGAESVCQQLLLLSSYEGWPWTKVKVLIPLFDLLSKEEFSNRTSVLRLLGYFLQLNLPSEEDVDVVIQKLQDVFQEMDDNELSSKAACVHGLLSHTDRLDPGTASGMRKWLQGHKRNLSNVLQEDFSLTPFVD